MTAAPEQKLDRSGVASALAAFVFWGLVPAYYKALQEVGSWEVLAHRVIWSVPILLVFLLVRDGRAFWRRLGLPLRSIAWLVLSGLTISLNWLIFVWAVANGHILDTSLGYFLTPLVNVLLGYLFLRERLPALQVFAVLVAAAGTVYLAWYLDRAPWIAITLALSFGAYGLLRKRLEVGPMLGLLWETALMFAPALAYLAWLYAGDGLQFLHASARIDLLLVGSGFATVLPLIWFNMAAQKLPLGVLGFFQYIGPSISFLLAVYLYGEVFTSGHAVAFACIWLALAMISAQRLHLARRRPLG